jgi:hypothetical protein
MSRWWDDFTIFKSLKIYNKNGKPKKYHTVRTVSKSNSKIAETAAKLISLTHLNMNL